MPISAGQYTSYLSSLRITAVIVDGVGIISAYVRSFLLTHLRATEGFPTVCCGRPSASRRELA
jgi:hypothetical protein